MHRRRSLGPRWAFATALLAAAALFPGAARAGELDGLGVEASFRITYVGGSGFDPVDAQLAPTGRSGARESAQRSVSM